MYTKFSKPLNDILKIKSSFFVDNEKLLKENEKLLKFYRRQPIRKICKNCSYKLQNKYDFITHNVKYKVCKKCSHLNGNFQDTKIYSNYCYKPKHNNYIKFYSKLYSARVKKVYAPKVNFLLDFIKKKKIKKISILDVGCGAGHFLKSLENNKIFGTGIETNDEMVNLGNSKLKKNIIICTNEEESLNQIRHTKANIVSMISVLEHLHDPNSFLRSISKSNIKYFYASIPMVSLSVLIENLFQNVFPRHLAATHTHLYTEKSIKYLLSKFGMKIVSEWWFGTDFLDLKRSFEITSRKNKFNAQSILNSSIMDSIDSFQKILDEKKICSELHFIARVNK